MISIIIPAFNEELTITRTIRVARKAFPRAEILVIDDGSTDMTYKNIPKKLVNKIIRQKNSGKGSAMKKGIAASSNDVILFLDADIKNLSINMVKRLASPVLAGHTDATIGYFDSPYFQGFTEVIYRPMIKLFFPEVDKKIVNSPLSGQRAIKKAVLEKIELEDNFGVEIAMNIDMVMKIKCNIREVSLGKLDAVFKGIGENRGPALISTMLKKANEYKRYERIKKSNFILLNRMLTDLVNIK